FIKPDIMSWHWTVASAMVFRRPILELVFPENVEGVRIGSDPYLIQLCHFFSGSIILDEALCAYRRHGGNTFSKLPLLGPSTVSAVGASKLLSNTAVQTQMRHVLDRYDELASVFSVPLVRKLVRDLYRYLLACNLPVDDPRIRLRLGHFRYYRDRVRHTLQR